MSTPATTPTSWVEGAADSGFDVDHLPYGVVARPGERPRVAVRIGDQVLDLSVVAAADMVDTHALFDQPTLNPFMAAGPAVWDSTRAWVRGLLTDETERDLVEPALAPLDSVTMLLPFTVGDYVDFYASEHHASNVGRMFRPDAEPLLPNWKHLPVGYHGRSGTVVVSGTDVVRPCGQRKAPDADLPTYGPSQRLDIEAELGFVVGVPSTMGERVSTADFARHTFGVVGLNDWSARDIQAWEYVPLGPFLGKSFATSISAWVTPLAALAAAWTDLPGQDDPQVLDYLRVDGPAGLDIEVDVVLDGEVVARPPYRTMYWSPAQMLAHTTVNGASVRTGDLWGSGTVSGPEPDQRGSLLELSWGGKEPFAVAGRERTFLEDGDEVTLRYTAPGTGGGRISLGEVTGRILPAR
jgi:fumarylacetoacetase